MFNNFKIKHLFSSILLGACFVFTQNSWAQEPGQKQNDELIALDSDIPVDSVKRERKHSPRLAMISSAIVPGLGQVYNQKYWKVPLIWGAGLALYNYFDWNNFRYQMFKTSIDQDNANMSPDDPAYKYPELADISIEVRKNYRDNYRRYRDQAIIYLGLAYVANVIDAMVDAHLMDYDISKDLSLHWQPTMITPDYSNFSASAYGAKIQFRF